MTAARTRPARNGKKGTAGIPVAGVKDSALPDGIFNELAGFFKVFGDETRIRILHALFSSPLCVGELSDIVGMSQSSVSHQLRLLKDARIVRRRKEGKTVYYTLDDEHVKKIFDDGLSHVTENLKRGS